MTMSEKELRLLWHHQLIDQTRLTTTDGRRVVIFSPGSENHDGGPDFREARIRIGNTTYVGDVEVHLRPGQWFAHRHHIDPHYNNVVLHVVLSDDRIPTKTSGGRGIPVLQIGEHLSGTAPPSPCPEATPPVPAGIIRLMARSLGIERLERKTRTAQERLIEIAGATGMSASGEAMDQLLYEGLMEGMGYAKNRVPFLFLARSVSLGALRRFGLDDRETVAAILFGAAGLLPRSVPDTESCLYVRTLRRRWARLRPVFRVPLLHPADWLFFRLRPVNFPTARLAAVASLLPVLFGERALHGILSRAADEAVPPRAWWRGLRKIFAISPDPFWSRHVHFAGPVLKRKSCLGRERLLDIAANLIIPSALLHARRSGGPDVLRRCVALLEFLPPASFDSRIRTLSRTSAQPLHPANLLEHQGMLELAGRIARGADVAAIVAAHAGPRTRDQKVIPTVIGM
jgi:hypothetical protein